MHELSIALSLVEAAAVAAKNANATKVRLLRVVVGRLSGVEKKSLTFVFPAAAEGSIVEGATLIVEESPVVVHCEACNIDEKADPTHLRCEKCLGYNIRVVQGDEILLRSMEVETNV